jgi:hypothetical protein
MKTVKREGGFETLLFGPDSSRHSRKNSAPPTHDSNDTTSSAGGKGTWTRVPESSSAGGSSSGVNSSGSGGVNGVHDVDTVSPSSSLPLPLSLPRPSQDASNTGHEGTITDLKSSSRDSLSEYAEDSVMVSSEGSDVYASAASLTLFDLTDIQDQDTDYAAMLSSEEGHDYMHPGQGPFSGKEPRRAVRFSENVEDNWEEICVDVTPFTTLSMPSHTDEEERQHGAVIEEVIAVEDTVIPRPDTTSQSRQESFMMRQSDYAEVQRKAAIAERAAADKAAQLLASNAAAELVFCEAMSTTLSSGDSPLESESDKVRSISYYPTRFLLHCFIPCIFKSLTLRSIVHLLYYSSNNILQPLFF